MFKSMSKSKWVALAVLAFPIFLTACKELGSQDPKDSFVSGKFPKQLEWIRSQMREIPLKQKEQLITRTESDSKRTDLVRVAVIDSGVDIAHKDLMSQIEYRIHDGKIVGAGFDILGKSGFGSHVLVNPQLFAFTPYDLVNGKIDKYPDSPLADLKAINDRFTSLILDGIKNDPALRDSFFTHLNAQNFTILGFKKIFEDSREELLEDYEENKKKDEIISTHTVASEDNKKLQRSLKNINEPWNFDSNQHLPEQFNYWCALEHYDVFVDLVKKSLESIDAEFSFRNRVKNYNKFEGLKAAKAFEFSDSLKQHMLFVKFGYDVYDPILNMERILKMHPDYMGMPFEKASRAYVQDLRKAVKTLLENPDLEAEKKKIFLASEKQLIKLENIFDRFARIKNDPVAYQRMRQQLRHEIIRNIHPYIAAESPENEHGTHVSGIIAKQNPKIRIVPIRVTTQSVNVAPDRNKEVIDRVMEKFQEFANTPYFEPLLKEIFREQGQKYAKSTVVEGVRNILKENSLHAVFIDDILSAIKATGDSKVKLANVSLGLSFEKDYSTKNKKVAVANDVFAEFVRFEMGRQIQTTAPRTLFVVATGNDGKWIDGISRTSFPVGVSSTRLAKISQELGLPESPNNSLHNILAVASVNPKGHLTQFTNILIDPKTPQIYSTGEEILSTVPGKSQRAASAEGETLTSGIKSLVVAMASEDEWLKSKSEKSDKYDFMRNLKNGLARTAFSREFPKHVSKLIHLNGKVDRTAMSGTSMATPTVTGVLAAYIADVMKKEKISAQELYDHPRFTPEMLTKDLFAFAKTNQLTEFITLKMIVDGIEKWKVSGGVKEQKSFTKYLSTPTCAHVFQAK